METLTFVMLGWLGGVLTALGWRLLRLFRHPPPGHALIVTRGAGVEVSFHRALVWPGLHQAALADLSAHVVRIDRRRRAALSTADHCRVDVTVAFTVQVDPSREGVLAAARALGAEGMGDADTIGAHLEPGLTQAVTAACAAVDFPDVFRNPDRLSEVIEKCAHIGLEGFRLVEVAVEHFAQSSLDQFDPQRAGDAEGLAILTSRLEAAHTRAEALRLSGQVERARQALDARRALVAVDEELMALGAPPLSGPPSLSTLSAPRALEAPTEAPEADAASSSSDDEP